MKGSRVWITLVLALVFILSAVSPALGAPGSPGAVDGVRVWVNYGPGRGPEVRQSLANARATFHYDFPDLEAYVVTLPAAALNGIQNNPHVLYVEDDAERYPIANVHSGASMETLATLDVMGQTVPYGIDMVQARHVWDTGRDGAVDDGAPTGAGRTVCIIDTGYYQAHDDLPDALGGYSQVDDNWARDGYGHGSHVGGTIAAENNGLGVVGVSPGTVELYIVKIFNDQGRWTRSSNLVDALSRCRNAGANVVSMSLGGGSYVSNENSAFASAYAAGVLSVAAAGNAGTTAYSYPASYSSVVSVAAVDSNRVVASFSQKNNQVELAAPGVGVLSTVPPNGYEAWSGTSMATPHVSGVAALVWSANPDWTNVQIREALQASAEDLGAAGKDNAYGYGLVQAKAALTYLGVGTPNTAPVVTITSPAAGSSFEQGEPIAFTATANDAEDADLSDMIVWTLNGVYLGTGSSVVAASLAAGTYTAVATATDAHGLKGNASVTVTVGSSTSQNITVVSLTGTSATINRNFWKATVVATVDPKLSGAVVSGTWTGGATASCTTDGAGQCTVSVNVRTNLSSIAFTVANVDLTGYTYLPGVKSVTISKP